jgi:hypothetical protein
MITIAIAIAIAITIASTFTFPFPFFLLCRQLAGCRASYGSSAAATALSSFLRGIEHDMSLVGLKSIQNW